MPTDQPVGFVCREDWVQPVEHQLNHCWFTAYEWIEQKAPKTQELTTGRWEGFPVTRLRDKKCYLILQLLFNDGHS